MPVKLITHPTTGENLFYTKLGYQHFLSGDADKGVALVQRNPHLKPFLYHPGTNLEQTKVLYMIYSSIYYQLSAFSRDEKLPEDQEQVLPGIVLGDTPIADVQYTTLATLIEAVRNAQSWHEKNRARDA